MAGGIVLEDQPNRGESQVNVGTVQPDWGAIRASTWNRNEQPPVREANLTTFDYLACVLVRKYDQLRAKRKGESFESYPCF